MSVVDPWFSAVGLFLNEAEYTPFPKGDWEISWSHVETWGMATVVNSGYVSLKETWITEH